MKTENEGTSSPKSTFTSTQWSSNQIPIDPALQQQSQQATTSQNGQFHYGHYPQATYTQTGQFQQFNPNAGGSQAQGQPRQGGGMDTSDLETLNDALGSAGVDLRAEEESLQRSHETQQSYRAYEDRAKKQPPNPSFDPRFLGPTMRTIGTTHKISKVPEDSVNYMALALRTRLQELITAMIAAAHHRNDTQFDRPVSLYENNTPMWGLIIRSDVAKQLAALEKVEREEEMKVRRERKERAEMAATQAASLAAQVAGGPNAMQLDGFDDGEGGPPKKKKKKDGPGVTARNMSEDVRKKMSNAVATQAAGLGGKYAWMNASNASAPTPKPKPAATSSTPAGGSTLVAGATPGSTSAAPASSGGSSWARPYVSTKKTCTSAQAQEDDTRTTLTIRDAMFVIEKERGHGGGRGAALGWT